MRAINCFGRLVQLSLFLATLPTSIRLAHCPVLVIRVSQKDKL
jgi:hypothetical protein